MNCDKIHKYVDQKLIEAAQEGDAEKVQELLNNGINLNLQNKYGDTVLMLASYHSTIDMVRLLLENRADVNLQNKQGMTVLIWASEDGNLDIVCILCGILLENKADVNLQSVNYGETALDEASLNGHLDVVKLLKNIHKTQIREGFKLTQNEDFMYIPIDLINYIGEFTY